jgi:hypothetical protein
MGGCCWCWPTSAPADSADRKALLTGDEGTAKAPEEKVSKHLRKAAETLVRAESSIDICTPALPPELQALIEEHSGNKNIIVRRITHVPREFVIVDQKILILGSLANGKVTVSENEKMVLAYVQDFDRLFRQVSKASVSRISS